MAKFIDCPYCGKNYNCESFTEHCPHCKHLVTLCKKCGTPNKFEQGVDNCEKCGEPLYVEATEADRPASEKKSHLSSWHTFATVMIVLEAIPVFIMLLIAINGHSIDWVNFIYVLAAFLISLPILAIVQLLAKIEFHTRKNHQTSADFAENFKKWYNGDL